MNTKHTPGPWRIRNKHNTVEGPDGRAICMANWVLQRRSADEFDYETSDANAHLIAAAPELLEACKIAFRNLSARVDTRRHWSQSDQQAFEQLDAAIRKAEGEA